LGLFCYRGAGCPDDAGTVDYLNDFDPMSALLAHAPSPGSSQEPRGPGGAGGGGGGITITNPSQEGPKQRAILDTINAVRNCLPDDVDCLAFLTRAGIDPLGLLTGIAKGGYYGHADISFNSDPNRIAAYVGGTEPAGQAITVNNQRAFYLNSVEGRGILTIGPSQLPGGTAGAQASILLHELGHLTGVLGPDLGVPRSGKDNDKAISQHCQKTINSLGR